MPFTRVFQFRCCDVNTHTLVVAPLMATREAVELAGGQLIKHSAQDVETVLVDALGFYPATRLQRVVVATAAERLAALGLQPVSACPASIAESDESES